MIDKSQCMLHCGSAPPALIRASATCRSSAVQHATWQRATQRGGSFWRRLICSPLQLVVPSDVARLSISSTTSSSSSSSSQLLLKIQLHAQTDGRTHEAMAGLTDWSALVVVVAVVALVLGHSNYMNRWRKAWIEAQNYWDGVGEKALPPRLWFLAISLCYHSLPLALSLSLCSRLSPSLLFTIFDWLSRANR